jgi:hypothetical protein
MGVSATYGFIGNPASITVGTGSYTVPANRYAYVSADSSNTADFEVSSTVLIAKKHGLQIFYTGSITATTDIFTPTAGMACELSATLGNTGIGALVYSGTYVHTILDKPGAAAVFISGFKAANSGSPVNKVSITRASGTVEYTIQGYYVKDTSVSNGGGLNMWLPTGTTITGGKYIAQEFLA